MAGKKYNWREFTLKVAVKAKPERVYRMWIEPKELVKWFLGTAKMELKKGGAYEWSWLGGGRDKGKIIATGNYETLVEISKTFKCMVELQGL